MKDFTIVDAPVITRRRSNIDYNALAEAIKNLPEGKSIVLDWNEKSIKGASTSIRNALKIRHTPCRVSINGNKVFVSSKKNKNEVVVEVQKS